MTISQHTSFFVKCVTFFICSILLSSKAYAAQQCVVTTPEESYYSFESTNQVSGARLETSAGVSGNSLKLYTNSIATIDRLRTGNSNNFTISLWVRPNNLGNAEARFLSQATGVTSEEHNLMISAFAGSAVRFRLKTGNRTTTLISKKGLLTAGKWGHIAVSYNGSLMRLYYNGVLQGTTAASGNFNSNSNIKTGIGNQPPGAGSRPFVGSLDELRTYAKALSSKDISELAKWSYQPCDSTQSTTGNSSVTNANVVNSAATAEAAAPPPQTTPVPDATINAAPAISQTSQGIPVSNWPANNINDDLPLGGVFYGTLKGGMTSGNGPVAYEHAIRFRAQRTGFVKAMRYNNRTLTKGNIDNRCTPSDPNSVWCVCKKHNLSANACGYTLSNSYHVGSGGLISIELRTNDARNENRPSSTVLQRSASFIPSKLSSKFPTIQFNSAVKVQAGQIYHLVFRNSKPPNCGLRKLSPAQARQCATDRGAISINGTQHASDPNSEYMMGPFHGRLGTGLHSRYSINGTWRESIGVAPFYELQYTDGDYAGDIYAGYDNTNYFATKGTRTIEGRTVGRQVFTVRDTSREANGLWLHHGHTFTKAINGKPLSVKIKDSRGTVLASGSISASRQCNNTALKAAPGGKKLRETRPDWMCRTWSYTDLSTVVSLIQGQTYSAEFSAPSGAAFDISTFFALHNMDEQNMWTDAQAQISTNNGASWTDWAGQKYITSRDIPMMFTLSGMPKQLP